MLKSILLNHKERSDSVRERWFDTFSVRPECRACAVYRGRERKTLAANSPNQTLLNSFRLDHFRSQVSQNLTKLLERRLQVGHNLRRDHTRRGRRLSESDSDSSAILRNSR